jgi:hypothetical protein
VAPGETPPEKARAARPADQDARPPAGSAPAARAPLLATLTPEVQARTQAAHQTLRAQQAALAQAQDEAAALALLLLLLLEDL